MIITHIISLSIMASLGLVSTAPFTTSKLGRAILSSISHYVQKENMEIGVGMTKKNIKLHEKTYFVETLKELNKNETKKFGFKERYAGIPKAWKNFKQLKSLSIKVKPPLITMQA